MRVFIVVGMLLSPIAKDMSSEDSSDVLVLFWRCLNCRVTLFTILATVALLTLRSRFCAQNWLTNCGIDVSGNAFSTADWTNSVSCVKLTV